VRKITQHNKEKKRKRIKKMSREAYYQTREIPLSRKPRLSPQSSSLFSGNTGNTGNIDPSHSAADSSAPANSPNHNVRNVNRRILPIDEPNKPTESVGNFDIGQGGESITSETTSISGFSSLYGSSFGFGIGAYVLDLTGLDYFINWMASFMPVRAVIGKQPDDLTERGIAHLMLIGILVMIAFSLFLYIVARFIRNRRGTQGQLRKISLAHYFGDPLLELHNSRNNGKSFLILDYWIILRHWIYRFMRSTGLHLIAGKWYSSGKKSRKKWE